MIKKYGQIDRLRDLISAIVYLGYLLLFIFFGSTNSFQITTNFLTNNGFANSSHTVFVPASKVLFTFQYRYLVIILLILLLAMNLYKIYKNGQIVKKIKNNIVEKKYLYKEGFIFTSLMIIVSLLSGVQDLTTIILIFIGSFLGMSALMIAKNKQRANQEASSNLIASIILPATSIIGVLLYSLGTLIYGSVRSTWYVYILDLIVLIFYLYQVFINTKFDLLKIMKPFVESFFETYLNIFFQAIFIIILLIGLHKVF